MSNEDPSSRPSQLSSTSVAQSSQSPSLPPSSFSQSAVPVSRTPSSANLSTPVSATLSRGTSSQSMSPSVIATGSLSSVSPTQTRSLPQKPVDSPVQNPDSTLSDTMTSTISTPKPTPSNTATHGDAVTTHTSSPSRTQTTSNSPTPRTTSRPQPVDSPKASSSSSGQQPSKTSVKAETPSDQAKNASTKISVVPAVPSSTSTVFTTITSRPETTFSTPLSISVTNPLNGAVSLTAPPVITLLSTSTDPNGALVTLTNIVANPTNVGTVSASNERNFLDDHGKVAGVFVVVGIVAAALALGMIWWIRRHRRFQRRRAWFATLRPQPPSPFARDPSQEFQNSSFMRSLQSDLVYDPRRISYQDNGYRPHSPEEVNGLGLTGIGGAGAGSPPRRPLSGGDPFQDPPHLVHLQHPQRSPVILPMGYGRPLEISRASVAMSSPSVYPESLLEEEPEKISESQIMPRPRPILPEPLVHRSLSSNQADAPPRPPKSQLRDSANKAATEYILLTPPTSISSHGQSQTPSPIEQQQVKGSLERLPPVGRRTLLDVRPRTAPDTTPRGMI